MKWKYFEYSYCERRTPQCFGHRRTASASGLSVGLFGMRGKEGNSPRLVGEEGSEGDTGRVLPGIQEMMD